MKGFAFIALLIPVLTGCSIHQAMLVGPANIGPKETPTEIVEGSSSGIYVLFFGPFGDSSLNAAVKDSLKNSKADSLLNVFVDKTFFSVLLFSITDTHVRGTAVKYSEIEKIPEIKKPDSRIAPL